MPLFNFVAVRKTKPEEMPAMMELRHEIFVQEQGIPKELDQDGKDESSIHVGVFKMETNVLLGCGRLTPTEPGRGVLSRIGVKASQRGNGMGEMIIGKLEKEAIKMGITHLSLKPHAYLENFYARLGYVTVEDGESTAGKYRLLTMEKSLEDLLESP